MRARSDDTTVPVPTPMAGAWHLDTHVGPMPGLLTPVDLVAAVFGISRPSLDPGDGVRTLFGVFHVEEVAADDTGAHVLLRTWAPGLVSRFAIDVRRTSAGGYRAILRNSVHPAGRLGRVYFRAIEVGHHVVMEIALRRLARRASDDAPYRPRWESWRIMPAIFAAHVLLYRRLGGRLVGRNVLILTTTGHKTGRRRSTPLFFVPDGGAWLIIASNGGEDRPPAWWHNIRACPDVEIEIGRRRIRCRAEAVAAQDEAGAFERLSAVHAGYRRYRQRTTRTLTIFRLTPRS